MKIEVKNIPSEGLHIETKEPKGILDIGISGIKFNEPVNVSIFVTLISKTLLVNGKLGTRVDLVCSRCLAEFKQVLEDTDFSLDVDVSNKDEVDITDDIREEIVLLVPIKPLCKKDCKGLCPSCGQDLNKKKCSCKTVMEDKKWSRLNKIKLEKE